jgi:hypothetical protein
VVDGYTRLSNVGRAFTDTPENGGFTSTLTGTFIRNSGIEAAFNVIALQTRSWKVSVGANISKNWNLIVREGQTDATSYNTWTYINGSTEKVIVPGYALGSFWAYAYAGPDAGYGIPTFRGMDVKSTNPVDYLTYAGSRISDISSGLNLRVSYKNVSAAVLCVATLGGKAFLPNPYSTFVYGQMPDPTNNFSRELLERWKQPGDASTFPGLYVVPNKDAYPVTLFDPSGEPQDRYTMWGYSDARIASLSNFRCRSIQVTWTLNAGYLKKIHVRNVNLTAAVNNVFLIAASEWKGMDPDLGGDRRLPRSYTMGVSFGF